MKIMTVDDVAEYLRADRSEVLRLIAKGDIPSFDVGGHPRAQFGTLIGWFQHEMSMRGLDRLKERLENPNEWANALDKNPEFKSEILDENHSEGSFGAFLKEAAQLTDDERKELDPISYPESADDDSPGHILGA